MKLSGRHAPFFVAVAAGVAALAGGLALWRDLMLPVATNAFFITYLTFTLARLPRLSSSFIRRHAASDDLPVALIFLVTITAVASAMVALFILLNAARRPDALEAGLTLLAVPLGWMTIHTMAAFHYAHLYWQPRGTSKEPARGLDFPGTSDPAGAEFLYFSFVIGMTAQTSDVQITSSEMRAINLVHAIVSFFFNTVLVAAAVNAAVALGN